MRSFLLSSIILCAAACGGGAPAVKCAADVVAPVVARIEQAVENKDYVQLAAISIEVGPELYACATQAKGDQVKATLAKPVQIPQSGSGSGSGSSK